MLDQRREQEVWQRVMAAPAQVPPCEKAAAAKTWTAQQVMELLDKELADAAGYEALARCVRGKMGQQLMTVAMQERQHAKKLSAVYYLMTGEKPHSDRPKLPSITCIREALRTRYTEEAKAAEQYAGLAEKAGSYGEVLRALACDEMQHGQVILHILQECL